MKWIEIAPCRQPWRPVNRQSMMYDLPQVSHMSMNPPLRGYEYSIDIGRGGRRRYIYIYMEIHVSSWS